MYHQINNIELPSYLSIEIKRDEVTARVFVHSKIHVIEVKEIPHSYSLEYSDSEILLDPDLYRAICNMYGLKVKVTLE